jgi:hypothetical protein
MVWTGFEVTFVTGDDNQVKSRFAPRAFNVFHKRVAYPSESPTSKHTKNQKIDMLISQQRRYNKFQKLEYKLSYVFRASYYGPNAIALVVI